MRTIKFRGRHLCGQWYYGNLIVRETDSPVPETPQAYKCVLIGDVEDGSEEEVEEETIGQFTGLLDKKNKKIYEGDIVSIETIKSRIARVVEWNGEKACWDVGGSNRVELYAFRPCEVIGNIHDNPELLKGE